MTAPPKRRWFRFGLRTMFVAVTVFGVWLGWQLQIVRERKAILAEIERIEQDSFMYFDLESAEAENFEGLLLPGETAADYEHCRIPFLRRMLGDRSCMDLYMRATLSPAWIERAENAFPEARLYVNSDDPESSEHFRDSLYAPPDRRVPNTGTIFKTGLIEK